AQEQGRLLLRIRSGDRQFLVRVPSFPNVSPLNLIGAQVRVDGVAARNNKDGAALLWVQNMADVHIGERLDPFDCQVVRVADLRQNKARNSKDRVRLKVA